MNIIIKWCNVVNCNFFYKDQHYNDLYCSLIASAHCHNMLFFYNILEWLKKWDTIYIYKDARSKKIRTAKLSFDTQLSLTDTTEIIMFMCKEFMSKGDIDIHF